MDIQTKLQIQTYLKIFYSKRWYIVVIVALSIISSVIYLKFERKIYKSTATILIDKSINQANKSDLFATSSGFEGGLSNHIEHIKSYKISMAVYNYLVNNKEDYPITFEIFKDKFSNKFKTERSKISWLRSRISASLLNRMADIIELEFKAYSSVEARFLVNIYQKIYIEENLKLIDSELDDLHEYLVDKIYNKEDLLIVAEENLNNFKNKNSIKSLEQQKTQNIQYYAKLKSDKEQMELDLEGLLETKKSLEEEILSKQSKMSVQSIEFNPTYFNNISTKIADKKARKIEIERRVKTQNLSFESFKGILDRLDREIEDLDRELKQNLKLSSQENVTNDPFGELSELNRKKIDAEIGVKENQKKIALINEIISKNEIENKNLPTIELQLLRYQREVELHKYVYTMLVNKKEETEIQMSSRKNNVKIIDTGLDIGTEIHPKRYIILFGSFFGGIFLSIGIILLTEYFDNTIKTEDELNHYNIVRLGMIPTINFTNVDKLIEEDIISYKSSIGKTIENRLICHIDPKSLAAESFRAIRTNLNFKIKKNKDKKSFLITSCGPQEGKSTTISNLAISFANQGSKVIIIDADLRKPVLHSVFGMEKEKGLTDYLIGDIKLKDTIKSTIVDNLFLITSGIIPPNPAEILGLTEIGDLVEELSKEFDLILFDTPPIIAVTDASILSENVDYSILVVRSNKTDRDMIGEAQNRLIQHNDNLLGCILNDFDFERQYGYKYQYYSYYQTGSKVKSS